MKVINPNETVTTMMHIVEALNGLRPPADWPDFHAALCDMAGADDSAWKKWLDYARQLREEAYAGRTKR